MSLIKVLVALMRRSRLVALGCAWYDIKRLVDERLEIAKELKELSWARIQKLREDHSKAGRGNLEEEMGQHQKYCGQTDAYQRIAFTMEAANNIVLGRRK